MNNKQSGASGTKGEGDRPVKDNKGKKMADVIQDERGVELTPRIVEHLKLAAMAEEGRVGVTTTTAGTSTSPTLTWSEDQRRPPVRPSTLNLGVPRSQGPPIRPVVQAAAVRPLVPRPPLTDGIHLFVPARPRNVIPLSTEAADIGSYFCNLKKKSTLENEID